jgi:ribosomal protein L16 Arg81 hydroxylase
MSEKAVFSLQDFINPISVTSFLKDYWSERFLFLPKGVKNVQTLFSWSRVNEILTFQKLPYPKIRLMGSEGNIRRELYTLNRKIYGNSTAIEQLDIAMINHHLTEGASLVLNGVDEMDSYLRDVCQELGKKFKNHTAVNAYMAFKDKNGFPIHWDDHETLIVQIDGRKHWKVFGASRLHPLMEDIEGNSTPPATQPLFDSVLEPGDVLYIPRGFWHVVTPVNEPSLHLTFSVEPANGYNWLQSIIDQCLQHSIVRQNIPIFSDAEKINVFQDEIKKILIKEISSAKIENYLAKRLGQLSPLPKFSLPSSVDSTKFTLPTKVRYSGITSLLQEPPNNPELTVLAFGHDWQIAKSVRPAIEKLLRGEIATLNELLKLTENSEFGEADRTYFSIVFFMRALLKL